MRRCGGASWTDRVSRAWNVECLDVLSANGDHFHMHGSWVGWDRGRLEIRLSAPYQQYPVGTTVMVDASVMLWRPAERRYVYRPRQYFETHSDDLQQWLRDHPEWDTDATVVVGPARFQ